MRTLKLSVLKGPDATISITLQGDSLTIGRAKTSDLVLMDTQVSREHAKIIRQGPDFVLVDLGGANGTLLGDGKKKIDRHTLVNGDLIHIGRNVLEASLATPPEEDATEIRALPDPDGTVTVLRPQQVVAPLTIKVLNGPDQGKIYTPDKDRVEIGRRPDCDVPLKDKGVSRLHATIRRDGGRYLIYDENSVNGIETPGSNQKLAFAELRDGMVLRLSETEIEVRVPR